MPKAKIKAKSPKGLIKAGKFKFDKNLVAVIAAVVVVAGGYVFYQGSHAASVLSGPPPVYARSFTMVQLKTTDSNVPTASPYDYVTTNASWCMNYYLNSALGLLVRCIELDPNLTKSRMILGSFSGFAPNTAWISGSPGISPPNGYFDDKAHTLPLLVCSNTHRYFSGFGPFKTALGPLQFGQEYRISGLTWQLAFSTYNPTTKACSGGNTWYNMGGNYIWYPNKIY